MAAQEQHYVLPRPTFEKPVKILIVVAPYYKDIADSLVAGAKAEIEAAGGSWEVAENRSEDKKMLRERIEEKKMAVATKKEESTKVDHTKK